MSQILQNVFKQLKKTVITLWFVVAPGFLPGSEPKSVNAPVRRIDYPGKVMCKAKLCSVVAVPLTTTINVIQL
jgi:hypothetical protein